MTIPTSGHQLQSRVSSAGKLELWIEDVPVAAPGDGEIVVRMEATPINPSDLGLLLGPADPASFRVEGGKTVADIPPARLASMAARMDQALPVGNEGAGTVVAAGAGAEDMVGKTVSLVGGAMYAEYRTVRAKDAVPVPAGATAADGASVFVNPLTALGMTETMKLEGHTALVHTAAASNLGQMLNKICVADGIALVNIVRSDAQAAILRALGATHIVDSSKYDFEATLVDALADTGATLAFDAIGGGDLAGRILVAMEAAANRKADGYSRYGSTTHKQVYIYGRLDMRPTTIGAGVGMAWGVGGWLLTPFLGRIGGEGMMRLRQRVSDELKTTFASHYTATISLADALKPDVIAAYAKRATGEKYLIDPSR
ncbi:zinc-binding dehydrogenase [Sphingomonas oligophenolica]|uniref:NADH oxidase n=1 Tax=Sphingomonas oligophenolica TaxID=301154 RepID=A0A502CKB4_9SPHN|nr:zinc-binding dehydrogenase [Sphingomonas oligophenolica]TPG12141.1 NADH oxidase [Sphingomonas oligophenolica]